MFDCIKMQNIKFRLISFNTPKECDTHRYMQIFIFLPLTFYGEGIY